MSNCDVAIVGAGPYGLAIAAHLRQIKGLDLRIFGESMEFWRRNMPQGMRLRSAWSASSIADPHAALTLDAYKNFSGNHLSAPVALERFVEYGLWFQRSAVPEVNPARVSLIEQSRSGFQLTLSDGDKLFTPRVIVAAGLGPFAVRPSIFASVPSDFVSHSSDHSDLRRFAGKRVAVIGGGQSALESAALLSEVAASVEVLVRGSNIHWLGWKERIQKLGAISRLLLSPQDVGPAGICWLFVSPALLASLPRQAQDALRELALRPAAARWLADRLRSVRITTAKFVISATPQNETLKLLLNDGSLRTVDHLLLGTGYRVDIARYTFLHQQILQRIEVVGGFPKLAQYFESSVPGLHFVGAPAAWSFGPLLHFVSGTRYTAQSLSHFFDKSSRRN